MMRPNRRAARTRGFTLVELVVVMTIIAILAGAAVITINNRVTQSKRARALLDIRTIEQALDLYAADNGQPPTQQQGLEALQVKPSSPPVPRNWNGPYLKKIKSVPKDPWGQDYVYERGSEDYTVLSYGEDGQPGGTSEADRDITSAEE